MKVKLDGIDKQILQQLIQNARTPVLTIANGIGISGAAIHQRLRKLEASGIIAGSKIMLNPKVLGYNTVAFAGVYLDASSKYKEAIQKLKTISEVTESHYTTGNYSIFIKIVCKNNDHLMEVLSKQVQTIPGVLRTETFISLDQHIDRQIDLNA